MCNRNKGAVEGEEKNCEKMIFPDILRLNLMTSDLPQTGSANLVRSHMFNLIEDDIDVPDGDVEYGKKLYGDLCAG